MCVFKSVSSYRLILVVCFFIGFGFAASSDAQTFHGAVIFKDPTGPDGTPRAHVGDTITAVITVQNQDEFLDTFTISNIVDVVHHVGGDVTSPNLLSGPLTLTSFLDFGGTNSIDVTNRYVVSAADGSDNPEGLLLDDARTLGTDNHDGLNGSHVRQDFLLTFPGQVFVLRPCLKVTKTCLNGVGAPGTVSFSGSVSNCGNTLLTNVVVSNFFNGAFVYVLGPTNLDVNQAINFTGNYLPNDPCHPATDTLTAWGMDTLGLRLTNSATATCPIRQTLSITCPSNLTVQCFADVPAPNVGSVTVTSSAGAANVVVTFGGDVIVTNNCVLTISRTYNAVDCWTNTASCVQTITVRDTIPPTLVGVPGNQTYSCLSQVPPPAQVTAFDNCATNVAVIRTSTTNGFRPTIIVNCWRAVDACGNAANACQTNTVSDLPAAIGDFVWEDRNHNGLQSGGEPGIANVTVQLLDCSLNLLATTQTGPTGNYLFTGLNPGSYAIRFTPPAGYVLTLPNVGSDDTIDSDADPVTGVTACVTVACGETNRTVDAGLFRPPALGDFVWEDRNHNGLQDAGEPGIPNALVRLLDCAGTEITRTNTDVNGLYLFSSLVPGSYVVQFAAPSGYAFTLLDAGSDDTIDSDANPADGKAPCVTLISGETNRTVDAGVFRTSALGDFVWEDRNHNGLQDAGEPGVSNVLVRLLNCSGTEITRTNTDVNGLYLFSGLLPGSYQVQFTTPGGYIFTLLDAGADDTIDSDANPADGKAPCVTLASGDVNRTIDAGLFRPPAIGDFVWEDRNHNGLQDAGEPGVSNALVRLLDCTGAEITRTNTDANGLYLFSGLVPGNYQIQFVPPGGYIFTLPLVGADRAIDSDANPSDGKSGCVTLSSGEINRTIDAGLFRSPAIGDFVWEDRNHNGLQDAGEPGISNALVRLLDCTGVEISHTNTDASGLYLFSGLVPGNYQVQFVAPSGYTFTLPNVGADRAIDSDANPADGKSACVTLSSGDINRTVDGGLFRPPALGDFVWEDRNHNGLQDAGELGIPNVLVKLLDCAGVEITRTNTDASGLYLFSGLMPGNYQVQFVAPSGYTFTLPNAGSDDTIDSDANPADGKSPCTTLSSGEINRTVDAGLFRPIVVGDFVWEDRNRNGIQDSGEPGISNALVRLLNCAGTEITRTNTDVNGLYLFSGLVPGSYVVQFTAPAGYAFTLRDVGSDDTIDSDANPADGKSPCTTLSSGDVNRTIDAGLFRPVTIGDFVWEDRNHNGTQDSGEPGISNALVRLLDCAGTEITRTNTGTNGIYLFSGLPPGSYVVQFVAPSGYTFTIPNAGSDDTIDSDANPADGKTPCTTFSSGETNRTIDGGLFRTTALGDFVWEDRNHNGLQDAGEPGIPNVLVKLLDCTGVEITRTNTDASGLYLFSNLNPGSYVVQFAAPSGYTFTLPTVGADRTIDSDANPADGKSQCVTLASGEVNRTIDAGLFRPVSLGDFVWEDRNHNGLQDSGEPGIPNVLVRLLNCAGTEITRTNTDASGLYLFSSLDPGSYIVQFVAPGGYSFTLANVGSNDAIDSDANPADGKSPCTTLSSGDVNRTVDAGLFRPATIGDFVWQDLNTNGVQDAGEPGVSNVVVRLLDCSGNLITSSATDNNGLYLFSGLLPGSYIVQFVAPNGYVFTLPRQGGDASLDSDADLGTGKSQCVTLSSGDVNLTVDAGLIKPEICVPSCVIGAWSDPKYRPSNKPPGRNQAFWARGISTNLVFYPQPGSWVENSDGSAQLSGTLRSLTNLSSGFFVTMTLTNRQTTPPAGSPIEEMDPSAYVRNGGPIDSSTWYYYTNFTGTLIGFGFWQGAIITFKPHPFGPFEIGVGANGKNTHFGATGWWAWTVVHQPASGNIPPQTIEGNINIDIICCQPSTIGDFVWQDLNQNGIQDAGEPGVPDAVVRLLDCTNKVVLTNTTTDANGIYQFNNLMPGSYQVQFVAPSGYQFTLQFQGSDIGLDSDADQATGLSHCISLSSNEVNLTVDAGLITPCLPSCVIGAWSDPTYRPADKPPGRNQAVWMRGISTNLIFTPDPGHFVENGNGTAQITGMVRSITNMTSGFNVTLNLTGRTTTPPPNSPMLELDPRAYVNNGGPIDPSTWYYYSGFTGTLTGFGFWQGAVLTVTPNSMAAFQIGVGANGKNQDFGASAWFDWKVTKQPASGSLPSTGMGDFNLDMFCCAMPRVVSLQKTSTTGRRMTIQGTLGPNYVIEGSVDMIIWKTITTLPNVNGVLQFNDTTPGTCCFYRVKMQP